MYSTIRVVKTKALIICVVTAQLICGFVFEYAKIRFSNDAAHILHRLYFCDFFSCDFFFCPPFTFPSAEIREKFGHLGRLFLPSRPVAYCLNHTYLLSPMIVKKFREIFSSQENFKRLEFQFCLYILCFNFPQLNSGRSFVI